MKEKVQKIKEFVWQKYVDYVATSSDDIVESEAVDILEQYFATVDPEEDPECYYLGILLFELAFQIAEKERLYLAKAKTIFEKYRTRTGETDWDVIEDRLEEIEDYFSGIGPDERAEIFAAVESDLAGMGSDRSPQEAIAVIEGMVLVPEGSFLSGTENEEKEVDAFYDENQALIELPYDVAAPQLRAQMMRDQHVRARRQLLVTLLEQADVRYALPVPDLPRFSVQTGNAPARGPAAAPARC